MNYSRILKRGAVILLIGVLLVMHAVLLHRLSTRIAGTAAFGLVLLLVLAHTGILGRVSTIFRRR